jgi:2-polyprenyl-3-methyl-5-hydroxy-6-metoxy-1,4-benzoquinol methylase
MRPSDLNLFCCPRCRGGSLALAAQTLRCQACSATFEIVRGLPRFVASDNYAASFGMQWQQYRRTQLDSVTGLSISRARIEFATGWPASLEGERMLEAGSGAGRFTEVLATTGAQLFTFDYSEAVDANHANNGKHENVTFFQGDIRAIPFPEAFFDKVICLGVLQHTPNPEECFNSLARHVRPGGALVVDVYPRRISSLLHWKYVLRPVTKRLSRQRLHRLVTGGVDLCLPLAVWLRQRFGRAAARLLPIVEYSTLGLPPALNREWAILDTFDMYSPAHDHPQTREVLRAWFVKAGFQDVEVFEGPNGFVGRGRNSGSR